MELIEIANNYSILLGSKPRVDYKGLYIKYNPFFMPKTERSDNNGH